MAADREPRAQNLLADVPAQLPEELVEVLTRSRGLRIERIVSRGHSSPRGFWYEQAENEFVLLVSGSARLRFADDLTVDPFRLQRQTRHLRLARSLHSC